MGIASSVPDDRISGILRDDPTLAQSSFPSPEGRTLTLRADDTAPARTLGYQLYGAVDTGSPASHAILFFHGTPGTRFFITDTQVELARAHNVLIVVPERAGFGQSTAAPRRTLKHAAREAARLMDALQVSFVHALGYSAGGPYALAFAHDWPERCLSLSVVSSLSPNVRGVTRGMAPMSRLGYALAARAPRLLHALVCASVPAQQRAVYAPTHDGFTDSENAFFASREDIRRSFLQSTLELYARPCGVDAEVEDYVLMAKDWGFRLQDIGGQFPIAVYGGTHDNKCTTAMFETIVSQLERRGVRKVLTYGENHLMFYKLFENQLFADLGIIPRS